jgi:hypothetical protein
MVEGDSDGDDEEDSDDNDYGGDWVHGVLGCKIFQVYITSRWCYK